MLFYHVCEGPVSYLYDSHLTGNIIIPNLMVRKHFIERGIDGGPIMKGTLNICIGIKYQEDLRDSD